MKTVSLNRWEKAQKLEFEYWRNTAKDPLEIARIIQEKVVAAHFAEINIPTISNLSGQFVEIGIGPLGVGCVHFLSGSASRESIGIEPLPLMVYGGLPLPLASLVKDCQERFRYIQTKGEKIGLKDGTVSFIACYNVIDHCHDPASVLNEAFRLLRSGGYILVGCDVISWLSMAKYHLYAKRYRSNTPLVICHPYRFTARSLIKLMGKAQFTVVAYNKRSYEMVRQVVGRGYRYLIVAKKN